MDNNGSWYNSAFDERDPHPLSGMRFDKFCSFPAPSEDIWQLMQQLNGGWRSVRDAR